MNNKKIVLSFSLMVCMLISGVIFCNNKVFAASNGESFTYSGSQGWWKSSGYYSDKINQKVVSGDFNGDGKEDTAAFYDNGTVNGKKSTSLHTWISTGSSFGYKGSAGWWKSEGYDSSRIVGKVISGDFNGDGKDDIAAFYKIDSNNTSLHVWISTGSSFRYQYSSGWWKSNGYNSDQISNRVVAGDFNGDGKDDIGAFYSNSSNSTSLHTWISTGSSFRYKDSSGWWKSNGYYSNQITGRVVAGDFNGDGKDDIGAFYSADAFDTRLHTWISTGSSFRYKDSLGWWNIKGYNSNQITNRVVAGDFNGDGSCDVAAFYANAGNDTSLHVWKSNASNLTRRIVEYSKNFLGVPYVWSGTTPAGFDCSGLVQYVYAHFGYSLRRTSQEQVHNGVEVSKDNLKPGDLVFFNGYSAPKHVGMYIGNGQFIEAPKPGQNVRISYLSNRSDFCRARRIIK